MMKTKLLALFLIIFMTLTLMSACGGGGSEKVSSDDTTGEPSLVPDVSPLEDYDGEWLTIYENGKSDFKVVRSEDKASEMVISEAKRLHQYFNNTLSAKIAISTDFVRRGETAPTDTKEILVGATNRAESEAAKSTLGFYDYIVKIENNRVVILGGTDEGTAVAVECFIKYFIKSSENDNGLVLQIPVNFEYKYEYDYPIQNLTVMGTDPKDCGIVYAENCGVYADILSLRFAQACGTPLPVIEKNVDEITAGFVLLLEENPDTYLDYSVEAQDKKIVITASSELALFNAVRDITTNFLAEKETVVIDADAVSSMEKVPADFKGISALGDQLVIDNKRVAIVIGNDGVVTKYIEKVHQGEDILRSAGISSFCYLLKEANGSEIYPTSLKFSSNGNVVVTFSGGLVLNFTVEVYDDFFTFELLDELPEEYYSITFADFKLDYTYDYSIENPVTVVGYSMNVNTSNLVYPNGADRIARGISYTELGTKGAKLAVITCPDEEQRDILKTVNTYIDKEVGLVLSTAGAHALDYVNANGDYYIQMPGVVENFDDWFEMYVAADIDIVGFHHYDNEINFRQGDFYFGETENGTAAEFKELVVDRLNEAGVIAGMHTYSFYISYYANEILSDPKWQQQLGVDEVFTLAEDMSASSTSIKTVESTEHLPTVFNFHIRSAPFVLIDQELIKIVPSSNGFVQIERGWGGTTPAEHKAGAEIRWLDGNYNLLVPEIGSELFYEIARRTAKAYNEGGFGMLMLDALNGMEFHVDDRAYIGMYEAAFINEILKYVETDPIMGTADVKPEVWAARSRHGDLDTPSREYNTWNRWRIHEGTIFRDRHWPIVMSWYDFWPVDGNSYKNYLYEYHYLSNVDYLGTLCVAYDAGITFNNLYPDMWDAYPGLQRNIERFVQYSRLKETQYFSEEVKSILRNSEYEFTLTQKDDVWGFTEVEYFDEEFHDTTLDNTLSATNDFEEQTPFVRIENLYTTKGTNAIVLMDFDETQDLKTQTGFKELKNVNISGNLAIRVRVYGNNSNDKICISLHGTRIGNQEAGYADYVITLDFEGWREFIFTRTDNGEFVDPTNYEGSLAQFTGLDGESFDARHGCYHIFRSPVNFASLSEIVVYTSGECEGVKIDKIEALRHVNQPLVNPTVKIGDTVLKIEGTINATEYLEYVPGEGAKVYDYTGASRDVTVVEETLTVPTGDFTATLEGTAGGNGDAPIYAALTVGVYGDFITN